MGSLYPYTGDITLTRGGGVVVEVAVMSAFMELSMSGLNVYPQPRSTS